MAYTIIKPYLKPMFIYNRGIIRIFISETHVFFPISPMPLTAESPGYESPALGLPAEAEVGDGAGCCDGLGRLGGKIYRKPIGLIMKSIGFTWFYP